MLRGLFAVLAFFIYTGAQSQSVSITTDSALSAAAQCVEWCIAGQGLHPNIVDGVFCNNDNSCFCRDQNRPVAASYLSSCLTTDYTQCANSGDYSTAISIYNRYCSFTGPATVIATATSTDQGDDVNSVVTVTTTSTPVITMQSSDSSTFSPTSESAVLASVFGVLYLSFYG